MEIVSPNATFPTSPAVGDKARSPLFLSEAPEGFEGEGFPVRRAFAGVHRSLLDPFIHMDQMGEVEYAPFEPRGTDWHPHRGFETVTYMLQGEFQHQDSHGGGGLITGGDTQWMTAGSGILHIETPPERLVVSGGVFHGVQLWVNLPASKKMLPPAYQHINGDQTQVGVSRDGGAVAKIIAGDVGGLTGPGSTHTPIAMTHVRVQAGHGIYVRWPKTYNALVYVLSGIGDTGEGSPIVTGGNLLVMGDGDGIALRGKMVFDVLVLGGEPIREPVAQWGPFVMNTKDEIRKALEDYRSGKMGVVPEGGLHPYRRTSAD